MKKVYLPILAGLIILLTNCGEMDKKVNLIVYSTNIYTVDSNNTIAQAMAVRDGKIIAIGSNDDIFDNYTAEEVYNGLNKAVYPGFIDGHCHFYGYGMNLMRSVDLVGTGSYDDILDRLKKHDTAYNPEWIIGRGWDQNDWVDKSWPTREKLDAAFPDKPVVLTRIDGHAALANSAALEIAGITGKSVFEGGDVLKDKMGQATGVLIDKAGDYMEEFIPEPSREDKINALLAAQQNCFAVGLTSVADAGLRLDTIRLIDSLHKAGSLKMKIYAMLTPDTQVLEEFMLNGPMITDKLVVRSVKLYADGALGSRGALLSEPYSDESGNKGLMMKKPEFYRMVCGKALQNGFQVNTHTIGDAGARIMLDIYAEYLKDKNDKRWRIEHAQIIHPEDLDKFAQYSIIPSIQATHATSDMYWADERLGPERIKWAYAFKDLLNQNGWLINGTDFPIENINPLYTFYASVARKDLEGYPEDGFQMENAMSREEALKSMTIWAAMGSFEEDKKGSLEVGKDADFVILDKDIMKIDENEIPDVRVVRTYLNGEEVYHNDEIPY